jgi:hypothetical protein
VFCADLRDRLYPGLRAGQPTLVGLSEVIDLGREMRFSVLILFELADSFDDEWLRVINSTSSRHMSSRPHPNKCAV